MDLFKLDGLEDTEQEAVLFEGEAADQLQKPLRQTPVGGRIGGVFGQLFPIFVCHDKLLLLFPGCSGTQAKAEGVLRALSTLFTEKLVILTSPPVLPTQLDPVQPPTGITFTVASFVMLPEGLVQVKS